MIKTFISLAVIAVAAWGIWNINSIVRVGYKSTETGISFTRGIGFHVNESATGDIEVVRSITWANEAIHIESFKSVPDISLSFRVNRDTPFNPEDESTDGRGGIRFVWQGKEGQELGYALAVDQDIVVVYTSGYQKSSSIYKKEFDKLATSLQVK